jgi:hypothetical protein
MGCTHGTQAALGCLCAFSVRQVWRHSRDWEASRRQSSAKWPDWLSCQLRAGLLAATHISSSEGQQRHELRAADSFQASGLRLQGLLRRLLARPAVASPELEEDEEGLGETSHLLRSQGRPRNMPQWCRNGVNPGCLCGTCMNTLLSSLCAAVQTSLAWRRMRSLPRGWRRKETTRLMQVGLFSCRNVGRVLYHC